MIKKITSYIGIALLAGTLAGCEDDKTPVYQEPTQQTGGVELATPAFASETLVLEPGKSLTFEVTKKPDYGFTSSVNYGLEVALAKDAGVENIRSLVPDKLTSKDIEVKESDISKAILSLHGIESQSDWNAHPEVQQPHEVYVRATAQLPGVASSVVNSEWLALEKVQPYFVVSGPEFVLYTPGNSNGWNQAESMILGSEDGVEYTGLIYLDGEFKFSAQQNWDGPNYGAKKDDAGNVVAGKLDTDGGASNLSAPTGLYWASVNTDKLTYSLEPITTLGVIGTFNGWGGDAEMTPDASHKVYTAEVNFPGDGEWKIRANNDWAISFGNSMENMTFNGGNLQDPGAGTYTVTFDLTTIPYTATCTK